MKAKGPDPATAAPGSMSCNLSAATGSEAGRLRALEHSLDILLARGAARPQAQPHTGHGTTASTLLYYISAPLLPRSATLTRVLLDTTIRTPGPSTIRPSPCWCWC